MGKLQGSGEETEFWGAFKVIECVNPKWGWTTQKYQIVLKKLRFSTFRSYFFSISDRVLLYLYPLSSIKTEHPVSSTTYEVQLLDY